MKVVEFCGGWWLAGWDLCADRGRRGHEELYGPESDLLRYYSLASNCRLDKQKQV